MKSRYSAYSLKIPQYIIKTTHKENQDYKEDISLWKKEILNFSETCIFEKLDIIEFIDDEIEAFVTFKATIKCENNDNTIIEKSRFIKELGKWYYIDGRFLENL